MKTDDRLVPEEAGLDEQAAWWVVRMAGPWAEPSRPEFDRWLARGALHRPAYERMARVYRITGHLDRPRLRLPLRMAIAASLVACCLMLAPSALQDAARPSVAAADQRAARPVRIRGLGLAQLGDGSRIMLDSHARFRDEFSKNERRLLVFGGHLRIKVSRQARPFVVELGKAQLIAHGTVFDIVAHRGRQTLVHLMEGKVEVRGRGSHGSVMLQPGQQVAVSREGDVAQVEKGHWSPDWETVVATFDEARLGDVIDNANRLAGGKALSVSPAASDLRLSGSVLLGQPDRLAEDLARLFDLEVVADGNTRTLQARP